MPSTVEASEPLRWWRTILPPRRETDVWTACSNRVLITAGPGRERRATSPYLLGPSSTQRRNAGVEPGRIRSSPTWKSGGRHACNRNNSLQMSSVCLWDTSWEIIRENSVKEKAWLEVWGRFCLWWRSFPLRYLLLTVILCTSVLFVYYLFLQMLDFIANLRKYATPQNLSLHNKLT